MQVILLKDVNKLGQRGEIKKVSDGYALNYLLPAKLAVKATAERVKQLKERLAKETKLKKADLKRKQGLAAKLKGVVLEIEGKVSDGGKLFAGVSQKDIQQKIKQAVGVEIEESSVVLDKHLKDLGEHQVEIDLGHNIKTQILVKIKAA